MYKSRPCLAAILLLGAHPLVVASQSAMVGEFEPLVVTATRTAETADETLASVTVITRDDIERLQAQSVQDLLRGVAGVDVVNQGGSGKLTSLFLRGTESDHLLVLINGVKVAGAANGMAPFQHIPIEQVERIEIVRGPRSSLYGPEAVGGVIQIFTRKGGGAIKPMFSAGAGSYESYDLSAGIAGGGEQGWFSVSLSGRETAGFNACNGKPFPDDAGCYTVEPDDDGFRNWSGSLRGGYRFASGLEIDAHAMRSSSETEYDGGFSNREEAMLQVVGATLRYAPLDGWQVTLGGGNSQEESDNFKDSSAAGYTDTERDTVVLQNDLYLGERHLITLGADYQDDRLKSSTAYVVSSRDNRGVFLQYQGRLGRSDIQLTLREDDNQQFGRHRTGGVAWGISWDEGGRFTISHGTAFRAPNFNELYYPSDPVWGGGGNPDLEPEESRSFELSLSATTGWGRWSLNAYETGIRNLIPVIVSQGNIGQARIRGLEAIVAADIGEWRFNGNLTLLDPRNRSDDTNRGKLLPRRPQKSLRLDADRSFGRYSFGATLLGEGMRYDDAANTRKIGAYATVDLRAEYAFKTAWLLQARVENLLDEDYETASYYNQPGRGFYLTLRYRP